MSTPAIPQENQGLDERTQALIKAEFDKLNAEKMKDTPGYQAPQADPPPIRVNVGGQEYNFASQDELTNFYGQRESEYQRRLEEATRQQPINNNTRTDGTDAPKIPGVNVVEFANLLVSDPVKAFDYIDQFRLGIPNAGEVLKATMMKTAEHDQEIAVQRFKTVNKDYEENEENAAAIMQTIQANKLSFTPQNLTLAWNNLKAQGSAKLHTMDNEPAPRLATPPPNVGRRSSQSAPDYASMAENLQPDQILNIIQQLEQSGKQ